MTISQTINLYKMETNRLGALSDACLNNGFTERALEYKVKAFQSKNDMFLFINSVENFDLSEVL